MADRPANQSGTHELDTNKPKKPKKTTPPAGGSGAGKGRYQWGTGGRVHSISQKTHDQRVEANRMLGGQDLTAPPSASQAITEANSAADLQFGPQVQAAKQLQANIAPWFGDYLARVAGYASVAQQQAAPVLQQAQSYQQGAAAQLPPGLDPNSDAGKQAAQAASGRQALGQLGLDALNANAGATQNYFGGQQAMAARQQPQAQAAADADLAFAQSQRGAKVQEFLTSARANAQNYAIARSTLAGNQTNQANQNLIDAGYDPVTGQKNPPKAPTGYAPGGPGLNKYGYTADQWDALSDAEKAKARESGGSGSGSSKPKGLTPAQQQAAQEREQKRVAGIRADSGKVISRVQDAVGAWNVNASKVKRDKDGNPVLDEKTKKPIRPSPSEIKQMMQDQGYESGLVHVALLIRAKKKLDQAAVDYLHSKGVRIPRDWLPYNPDIKPGSSQDPKPTSGQSGGLGGK